MKALAVILLAAVAACGEGRAIFNVDVYSFMAGTGNDTVPYVIPIGVTDTVLSPPQKVSLPPGFGNSVVDSVRITSGGANLINTAGTGTIGFQLYIAGDSLGALSPSALAIDIPPTAVNGAQTVAVVISGDLSPALNSVFTNSEIWLSIGAVGSNTGGVIVTGDMALTALQIRVVMQEHIL
ncbi:MAG: hypothetical protein Q8Q14_03685 [Gemmatimonadales bacterium]|nr:hypothetical protein [Gemmatimonadales bacterium]